MVKLAQLLKMHPLEIIACVNYHKAATSIKLNAIPTEGPPREGFGSRFITRQSANGDGGIYFHLESGFLDCLGQSPTTQMIANLLVYFWIRELRGSSTIGMQ